MPAPRVLLADDHHLLLGALEKLLQEDCQIVGRVSDGHALVAAAQQLKPDVIVLDVAMPLLNGLEAGRQIKQVLRSVKLIYVTMNRVLRRRRSASARRAICSSARRRSSC